MHDSSFLTDPAASARTGPSRRSLLGKAALLGLGAAPVLGLATSSTHAAPQQQLDASSREAFTDIRLHENDHVARARALLGSRARPKPTFKNLSTANFNAFVAMARMLENTDAAGLLGLMPLISSRDVLAEAGSFALIEGRQAGFLNVFSGVDNTRQEKTGTPSAFEKPLTVQEVVSRISPFIASLNGGPPLTVTPGNDVSILNFILVDEYLGAEFYNINIPKYF
ncbi:MAG TPA: ferritin-like domain-containing protein [Tepidisphaeraceae bacterium]|jgi:hypothetical protein